jgi:glutamate N-acetyltransferase / amino-acid N-acetyltransferase
LPTKSPLAPDRFPDLAEIRGVTLRTARARYKEWDRCDLTFITLNKGTSVAGVTTQNVCCSTEVEMCRESLRGGSARALVVNAGNSNAFTGYRGQEAVSLIMRNVAQYLGCDEAEVFVSSTGVIGVPLPMDKAEAGLHIAFEAAPCHHRYFPQRCFGKRDCGRQDRAFVGDHQGFGNDRSGYGNDAGLYFH